MNWQAIALWALIFSVPVMIYDFPLGSIIGIPAFMYLIATKEPSSE